MEAGGKALSKTFTRRLIWRDLAYWQLHHWPAMAAVPMRPHYAAQVPGFFLSAVRQFRSPWSAPGLSLERAQDTTALATDKSLEVH